MRINNEELTSYISDLDSWTSDMKKKDQAFQEMKPKHEVNKVPPVRGSSRPKINNAKTSQPVPVPKPKKLRSYDYDAWEKLDVDKMISDIDQKHDDEEAVKEEEKAVQLEQDLKLLSVKEKEKGNENFKKGNYVQALECYTRGMQHDPCNAVLPANRAMAYLKLEKYVETEVDCTLALSLDPTYTKAYLRRGTARLALNKVESAVKDFKDALKLEPDNGQAKRELEKIAKEGKSDKPKEILRNNQALTRKKNVVVPIKKPQHLRSKKPLRRVPVDEVGGEEKPTIVPTTATSRLIEEVDNTAAATERVSSLSTRVTQSGDSRATPPSSSIPTTENNVAESKSQAGTTTTIPPSPKTCYQLQADVKKIKGNSDLMFQYLKQIIPESLPSLLKDQLDADILSPVIQCFKEFVEGNEAFVASFLKNISSARRFDMTFLFLSKPVRKDVEDIIGKIDTSDSIDSNLVKILKQKYKCC